ncbi:PREDICTED: dynein light chain [Prunus dulcis]|uniref:PREDICTED: dynein light chain n=1 Tax=Prunus dulcis TaxID=3755 RepID=A0A5E4EPL8_PRUDU|nr:uncharacterized protein LOC117627993 isoform X1 [Prunus dulcis]VVA17010.1 PREDICTED: dynein light chain [Prunus dulcis]
MANQTTQRRILAAPEPKASMNPTLKKHTKPSISQHLSNNLDSSMPSKPSSISSNSSRVNTSHRVRTSQRPNSQQTLPALTDTRLQAKAMSVSAIMGSSKSSIKSNPQPKSVGPNIEKQSKTTKELACKDKSQKSSKDVEKKKFEEEVVKKKKEAQKGLVGFKEEHEFDNRRLSVPLNSSGGRRRSLSGSQVQLADVLSSYGVKIVSADMPPFMQIHAVECARKTHDSLEKFTSKTLALTLKKEFDGVYGPAWHCIVGTSFGSFVTHSVSGFLYFSMDQKMYVLLFKTTVQRAD